MAYLCIDLFRFPDDATAKKFEDACAQYRRSDLIFTGRIARDPLGKYTHAQVWKFEDFSSITTDLQNYAATLDASSNPLGEFPGYMFKEWWGFRVAALDDPIVAEHGIEEWSKREADYGTRPLASHFKNPARVTQWFDALNKKLQQNFSLEALKKSHWVLSLTKKPDGDQSDSR